MDMDNPRISCLRGCRSLLARAAWFIMARIHPQAQPWWSNSMGQYNLLKSCMDEKNANMVCSMIAKIMGLVGAYDIWNNMRHVKHTKLTRETKDHIYQTIVAASLGQPLGTGESKGFLFRCPFEVALLTLHIWTDVLLHKVKKGISSINISGETQSLMDTCKVISDYMMYLLVAQPTILPISGNVQDLPAVASTKVKAIAASSKEQFLEARGSMGIDLFEDYDIPPWIDLFKVANVMLLEEGVVDDEASPGAHTVFETLARTWVRLLAYAAGKSSTYDHARRLSKGGELITFVWLFMVHQGLGDQGPHEVDLVPRVSEEGQSLRDR
uniref:DUF4220 domain-containing protein n=1 Tax=Leersia perrieri TaxID=77586 RepID=A0A0D9XP22_9ORYZ